MFKINAINGDVLDTTSTATNVLGKAGHKALEAYFGGGDTAAPAVEAEAVRHGYEVGRAYLDAYSDGLIEWNSVAADRAKLCERYSFAYFGYLRELGYDHATRELVMVEKMLKHRVEVEGKLLPVPLKGQIDLAYRDAAGVHLWDHKFTSRHSGDDEIDGAKLLQAAFYYLLAYAELGEPPVDITFAEYKVTENKDKAAPQLKRYTLTYASVPQVFDLFFRFYEDVTDALLGKMVYVPNINALYDREVSLLAYIHRLDVDEERAKQLKKAGVDNITDFLRRRIARERSIHTFMSTAAKKFATAVSLNYSTMTTEEKIKMKLAEHGIGVEFDSKVVGPSVTLYRYEPSIGVKMSRLEKYAKDIEQVTASSGIRILAPIPGTDLVGFEVPNRERTFLGAAPAARSLRVAVGVDIQGQTQYIDMHEAPHVLIAGSTGSGKSVALTSMLRALGGTADLWLMDPKQVELHDIPHARYGDTTEQIAAMLQDLCTTMDSRYAAMKQAHQRTYTGKPVVAVVDEFGDLMLSGRATARREKAAASVRRAARKESARVLAREAAKQGLVVAQVGDEAALVEGATIEDMIVKLAQKGRAAGIHLIIATQRPSVDVVTGLIKANFPTRIALKTASAKDSEVILGVAGAEKLCGKGDMLLTRSTEPELVRLQGFSA